MTKYDLEEMTLDELWELHERVSALLSTRMLAEKEELESRLAQLNRGGKFSLIGEIDGGSKSSVRARPRRKYPQVYPKYQNPSDPTETWSGRGKQPRWLVSALRAGGKIDDFRIPAGDERLRARG
jgi:DNA-binding protein H-NS